MIDLINKTVKSFLNTDDRGNYSPQDFDLFLQQSVEEIYEGYLLRQIG